MPIKLSNKILLLACALFATLVAYNYSNHKTIFHGDSFGYYRYLPSAFIYRNLTSYEPLPTNKGLSNQIQTYAYPQRDDKDPSKIIINQYTYGIALLEAPFFFLAHIYELAKGSYANGYSTSYEWMIKFSALFYALLGLVLVYKILRRYFDETLSTIGTIAIFLGTNLFWFTTLQAGMSHVPLFFLYALLMHLTIKVHDRPRTWLFIGTGLTAGMITIIRPTDIICVIIPLLYQVYNWETIKKKFLFIKENLLNILYLSIAFIIPIIPQLIYWKTMTGHWLYYSYRDQSFDWQHPKIIEGLFHFSNGWLPYSPLMIFALLGQVLYRRIKDWAWCSWLLLPVYIYIIYSWYCYRYINGLGSRPMIHLYPLLAIPLTAFIQLVSQRVWAKVLFGAIAVFFVAININYSYQQMRGLLWSEESNMTFNTQMLFRTELKYEDLVVNDIGVVQPDTSKLIKVATVAVEQYNDSTSEHTQPDPLTGHRFVYHMYDQEFPDKALSGKYNKQLHKDAKWIKCSGRFMYRQAPDYYRHMFVVTIPNRLWQACRIENKTFDWHTLPGHDHLSLFDYKADSWGYVYYFVRVPKDIADGDEIKLHAWSLNKAELFIDDLSIELYK